MIRFIRNSGDHRARTDQKARHDQPWSAQRSLRLCQAEFVFARHADRFERTDDPADFGHGIDRRERRERAYRRFSRADASAPWTTLRDCWRAKAAPGTTSCAPVATCATSSATMRRSTKSAPRSTRSRGLIRCRRRPASRRILAGRSCWWRLKPSRCSARRRRGK